MRPIYVKSGDVFFTRSSTVLGKLIRWAETDPNETETWANHTGVVDEEGWVGAEGIPPAVMPADHPAIVIEALWHTRRGPLVLNGTKVRFFRPVPGYSYTEVGAFWREAKTYVGDKYGWWKLGVQLADRLLFKGKKILTTGLYIKSRPICSFLVAMATQQAQSADRTIKRVKAHLDRGDNGLAVYAFGCVPQAADPDTMMDYCLANPSEWQEVK